ESLVVVFDAPKIYKIVANLLSNAIKYTHPGGHIYLQVTSDHPLSPSQIEIKVKDTGIGISESDKDFVFDRFYQQDETSVGTGLGLALSKELSKLMGASLELQSQLGEGSTFILSIPIPDQTDLPETPLAQLLPSLEKPPSKPIPTTSPSHQASKHRGDNQLEKPRLLLIEDNQELAFYLEMILKNEYQTQVAHGGDQGLKIATEIVPDLILTDAMLPGMDGFSICQSLKQDIRTSHIPIVILTARGGQEDKILALRQGADAYMSKPFDKEELLIRLQKLLELRQQLQHHYLSQENVSWTSLDKTLSPAKELSTNLEEGFIQKLRTFILANLSDQELNVNRICQEMGMSRTQLHNKLKALTGKSTTQFVRSLRLIQAKQLLKNQPDKNIAEIAQACGLEPNYFSRLFVQAFELTPSEYRETS
ncbi:MAG: ATP-binding protein, partial [Bacteroidota bacterium]